MRINPDAGFSKKKPPAPKKKKQKKKKRVFWGEVEARRWKPWLIKRGARERGRFAARRLYPLFSFSLTTWHAANYRLLINMLTANLPLHYSLVLRLRSFFPCSRRLANITTTANELNPCDLAKGTKLGLPRGLCLRKNFQESLLLSRACMQNYQIFRGGVIDTIRYVPLGAEFLVHADFSAEIDSFFFLLLPLHARLLPPLLLLM